MTSQLLIPFPDKTLTYDEFIEELSSRVAIKLKEFAPHPEILSQNQAWKIFSKKKVNRWVKEGKYEPIAVKNEKTGNITKLEYSYSALLELQTSKQ